MKVKGNKFCWKNFLYHELWEFSFHNLNTSSQVWVGKKLGSTLEILTLPWKFSHSQPTKDFKILFTLSIQVNSSIIQSRKFFSLFNKSIKKCLKRGEFVAEKKRIFPFKSDEKKMNEEKIYCTKFLFVDWTKGKGIKNSIEMRLRRRKNVRSKLKGFTSCECTG